MFPQTELNPGLNIKSHTAFSWPYPAISRPNQTYGKPQHTAPKAGAGRTGLQAELAWYGMVRIGCGRARRGLPYWASASSRAVRKIMVWPLYAQD